MARAETDLGKLTRDLSRRWGIPSNALATGLRLNARLTRSIARYRGADRVIELGPGYFRLRGRRREVLCHELAHAAVGFLYDKRVQPHGSEWRTLVELAGFRSATHLTPSNATNLRKRSGPKARKVYEHRCPVCQMTRRAKRPVGRWRCAACVATGLPGILEVKRVGSR